MATGTSIGTRGLVSGGPVGVGISTLGLVGYGSWPSTAWSDLFELVTSYLEDARAASSRFRAALESGVPTSQQLQRICADREGLAEDAWAIRDVLDTTAAADWQLYPDPARLLALWRAERASRVGLVRSEAALRAACAVADELREGDVQTEHVVRAGETYQSIAQLHYGDHRAWRRLRQANRISPSALTAGTVLVIPRG